ncbi:hypothetical protein B0H15DRAFT_805904 [Mycena belliarum]|uniref:Integrase catalytic domain-containing protein n=1 Tax=Mycena belliarum TaxID=1033014 RepID=A0AAD6TQ67_9AGAR|nr:hypothetical protein B0H15DRAFT_805904 [Mycena belliae]
MSSHNRNPTGKNQHARGLRRYHTEAKTDNKEIAALLFADYGIRTSASTVKRRRKALKLTGGAATAKTIEKATARQLVLSVMDKDPAKRAGVRTVRAKIAFDDSVILPRKLVSDIMHEYDSESFAIREPTAKKIFRVPKHPIGTNQRWSCDGHDKLYKIGFPVWAIVDDGTGKILKGWVVPSNRILEIIAFLFLCLVAQLGGIPIQTSTDCGQTFHPDIDIEELPAHVYLRSVHNIAVERQWLRLRLDFGDNCVLAFNLGITEGRYNSNNPNHLIYSELSQWLWSRVIQKGVDDLPEKWGGRDCLLPVDVEVVEQMKEDMGGDALIAFSTPEFAERALAAYDSLGIQNLTLQNAWSVFEAMLPLVFPIPNLVYPTDVMLRPERDATQQREGGLPYAHPAPSALPMALAQQYIFSDYVAMHYTTLDRGAPLPHPHAAARAAPVPLSELQPRKTSLCVRVRESAAPVAEAWLQFRVCQQNTALVPVRLRVLLHRARTPALHRGNVLGASLRVLVQIERACLLLDPTVW